jgi:membrane protease YdiL (CAAX protease family)
LDNEPGEMFITKKAIPGIIHRYPVISFFILAWILGASVVSIVLWNGLPSQLIMISVLSASFSGILITAVVDGKSGLKLMFSRLLIWRAGVGYWLFALFFIILTIIAGSLFNPLFQGNSISVSHAGSSLNPLVMFFIFFIISGLGQELGWTGFLIPRLQSRFSALNAAIIRTIFVGIWHLPIFIYSMIKPQSLSGFQYAGWIAQKGFTVAYVIAILMIMLPWSIFFSWIFNNTKGSLLLVSVLHGSEIFVALWMMSARIDPANLDNYWGYGLVMILSSIMIVVINGPKNFSRKYERIVHS